MAHRFSFKRFEQLTVKAPATPTPSSLFGKQHFCCHIMTCAQVSHSGDFFSLQVCRELYEVMTQLAEQHSDKVFTIQGAPRSVQDPPATQTKNLLLPTTSSFSLLTVTRGPCDWPGHRPRQRMTVHPRARTRPPITCCAPFHLDRHGPNLLYR